MLIGASVPAGLVVMLELTLTGDSASGTLWAAAAATSAPALVILAGQQFGKKKVVLARYVHNDRLLDALGGQAFAAISRSPGARAHYDKRRTRGMGHRAALRQLAKRVVGSCTAAQDRHPLRGSHRLTSPHPTRAGTGVARHTGSPRRTGAIGGDGVSAAPSSCRHRRTRSR